MKSVTARGLLDEWACQQRIVGVDQVRNWEHYLKCFGYKIPHWFPESFAEFCEEKILEPQEGM